MDESETVNPAVRGEAMTFDGPTTHLLLTVA